VVPLPRAIDRAQHAALRQQWVRLRACMMHVHGSRALTAEGVALAATASAVGVGDGGANYLDKRQGWTHRGQEGALALFGTWRLALDA
jgi:hypothetical protein